MGGLSSTDALNAALNVDQTAFDVILASTGQTIQVSMALETVVVTTNNALEVSASAALPVSTGTVTATITGTASTLLDPYDATYSGIETAAAASTAYQCTNQVCVTVAFKAHPDNAGNVWLGDSNVSGASAGFPLDAGESVSIRLSNVNKAYYYADTAGDKLCWIAIA